MVTCAVDEVCLAVANVRLAESTDGLWGERAEVEAVARKIWVVDAERGTRGHVVGHCDRIR